MKYKEEQELKQKKIKRNKKKEKKFVPLYRKEKNDNSYHFFLLLSCNCLKPPSIYH